MTDTMTDVSRLFRPEAPLVLIGCGRMAGALLARWRSCGLDRAAVRVVDPAGAPEGIAGVSCVAELPDRAAGLLVLAVKPQSLAAVAPAIRQQWPEPVPLVSILAGTPLAALERQLGPRPLIRAMPNIPAQVGAGLTAFIANSSGQRHSDAVRALFASAGAVLPLQDEEAMDVVTAVSGSGPAYLFHVAEALAAAARTAGLDAASAALLARQTVVGSARLLEQDERTFQALRAEVTSPGGTTAAGLAVLMDEDRLENLMTETVAAAAARSRALGQEGAGGT